MIKITIIAVGKLKEKYFLGASREYEKRLSRFCKLNIIEIEPEKLNDNPSDAQIEAACAAEGKKILQKIPDDAFVSALCIEGKQYSSEELAAIVGKSVDATGKLCFIIGSSHGLAEGVKAACDYRLSFSKLTFPHQLVRPLLFEVIYRSFTILAGKKYHK